MTKSVAKSIKVLEAEVYESKTHWNNVADLVAFCKIEVGIVGAHSAFISSFSSFFSPCYSCATRGN